MTTALTFDLDNLALDHGAHSVREGGVCLLEAVAWYAGEDHSDSPACVSPVLRMFGTRLNDRLPADRRQELKKYIPQLVGTRGDGRDLARGFMAADWIARTIVPKLLDLVDMHMTAQTIRGLAPITDRATADVALPIVRDARRVLRERYNALGLRADAVAAVVAAAAVAVAAAAAAVAADADAVAAVAVAVAVAADARNEVYTEAIEFYGRLIAA